MFAKLLAELKKIAILLKDKKIVDKDYKPDGKDFIVVPGILDTRILKFNYYDLIKVQTVEYKTYTVGEILTDEFINFVNANKEEFLNYKENDVYGSFFTNKIADDKYKVVGNSSYTPYFNILSQNIAGFNIWSQPISGGDKLAMNITLFDNDNLDVVFHLGIAFGTCFIELTKDLILTPINREHWDN